MVCFFLQFSNFTYHCCNRRNRDIHSICCAAAADAENVGYMIPTTLVRRFIEVFENQEDGQFPTLGLEWQPIESDALRRHLGMTVRFSCFVHCCNSAQMADKGL